MPKIMMTHTLDSDLICVSPVPLLFFKVKLPTLPGGRCDPFSLLSFHLLSSNAEKLYVFLEHFDKVAITGYSHPLIKPPVRPRKLYRKFELWSVLPASRAVRFPYLPRRLTHRTAAGGIGTPSSGIRPRP
jgi:hypothetical protein